MSLTSAAVDLGNALQAAREAWEDARAGWDDPVRWAFEDDRWAPIEEQARAVLQAMDRLAPVLAAALRECS